jgi:hypothetical protein
MEITDMVLKPPRFFRPDVSASSGTRLKRARAEESAPVRDTSRIIAQSILSRQVKL